jgi:hypothetical protein
VQEDDFRRSTSYVKLRTIQNKKAFGASVGRRTKTYKRRIEALNKGEVLFVTNTRGS